MDMTPNEKAALLMEQCADLSRSIEALRQRLSQACAADGIGFDAMGKAATLDEQLRRTRTMLVYAFDISAAMHATPGDEGKAGET